MKPSVIERALEALDAGELVVMPTDTVYGIAARPEIPGAVERIFAVKKRSPDKPVPVLGGDRAVLETVAIFDDAADRLSARYWPGALTLVLPRAPGFIHDLGGAERTTVAVRVPANEVARRLLDAAGPLAVTSANLSGAPEASTAQAATDALGDWIAVYVDGGPSRGVASTIVDLTGAPAVLRAGAIDAGEIVQMLTS